MAIYHLRAKVISRSKGQSAVAGAAYRSGAGRSVVHAAAYRSGGQLTDERTGRTYDYSRKEHVEHTEIMAPDDAPAWMHDRQTLWGAVERVEKRKDAQLSRELEITLPRELSPAQCVTLVRAFVRDHLVGKGMVADIAIHRPTASDGGAQPHAHVMLTMRRITEQGFGNKVRAWNEPQFLKSLRAEWANYANRALEKAGRDARIDHRRLTEQGNDREAAPYVPQLAFSNRAKRLTGYVPDRMLRGREVRHRNRARAHLRAMRDLDPRTVEERIGGALARTRPRPDFAPDLAPSLRKRRRLDHAIAQGGGDLGPEL